MDTSQPLTDRGSTTTAGRATDILAVALQDNNAPSDSTWTVIGLVDNTSSRLTVAGVVAGQVDLIDTDPGDDNAQRYATTIHAPDPDSAAALAIAAVSERA